MAPSRSEVARAKLLDAAVELLLEVGVHAFAVDEVARRSGVAKTTIYRHFPSRSDLVVGAIDAAMLVPPTPDTGSLRDDLIEFLTSVRPIFADERIRAMTFDIYASATRDPELRDLYATMMARRSAPTRAIFERAKARGEIADDLDYLEAFEIIEGPFIVRGLARPHTLEHLDIEALVDRILPRLKT